MKRNITDIKQRVWPLIVTALGGSGLCHISNKNAKKNSYNVLITRCGKVLTRSNIVGGIEAQDRLCVRCGTQAEFESANAEYLQAQQEKRKQAMSGSSIAP